jgi:hypothetical protein
MANSHNCAGASNDCPGALIVRVPLIAVAAALSFGCGRAQDEGEKSSPPRILAELLHKGDTALQSMQEAAVSRNYDEYFRQYASLRDYYIEVAASLKRDQRDNKTVLETLANWESMIKVARNAWREIGDPKSQPLLDTELLSIDTDSAEFQAM